MKAKHWIYNICEHILFCSFFPRPFFSHFQVLLPSWHALSKFHGRCGARASSPNTSHRQNLAPRADIRLFPWLFFIGDPLWGRLVVSRRCCGSWTASVPVHTNGTKKKLIRSPVVDREKTSFPKHMSSDDPPGHINLRWFILKWSDRNFVDSGQFARELEQVHAGNSEILWTPFKAHVNPFK